MINYTVSLVRESDYSAMSHFKNGFKGIKNGHKTWFKFFIAVLLINLIIIIITQPLGTILSVTTGNMSQKVATVILYVAQVIIVVLRLILYFVLIMGAVQYFLKRGEKLNKTTKEKKKKHKNKDKSVTNKNETLSNQQKLTILINLLKTMLKDIQIMLQTMLNKNLRMPKMK